jgi:hypothetical protein
VKSPKSYGVQGTCTPSLKLFNHIALLILQLELPA